MSNLPFISHFSLSDHRTYDLESQKLSIDTGFMNISSESSKMIRHGTIISSPCPSKVPFSICLVAKAASTSLSLALVSKNALYCNNISDRYKNFWVRFSIKSYALL